jgi:hypothetical protein
MSGYCGISENISINQLIATTLAEKLSALKTEDYLKQRGERGSKVKFNNVLSKVASREPEESDRL